MSLYADWNTIILFTILLVVIGIGGIHLYKLKKQCYKDREKK